jgi:hypothetical protein
MGEDFAYWKCRPRRRGKKSRGAACANRLVADMLQGRISREIDRRREKANMAAPRFPSPALDDHLAPGRQPEH